MMNSEINSLISCGGLQQIVCFQLFFVCTNAINQNLWCKLWLKKVDENYWSITWKRAFDAPEEANKIEANIEADIVEKV